jgi:hypothetical protein
MTRVGARDRFIETFGDKAVDTPRSRGNQVSSGILFLLAKVFGQAFAKVQPGSPEPRLHSALTQTKYFSRLID